jgi:hypothetical protein
MTADPNWMDWQREHDEALRALQDAQRAYHRAVSGEAFAAVGAGAGEATRDALRAMDNARVLLDGVRARQPR